MGKLAHIDFERRFFLVYFRDALRLPFVCCPFVLAQWDLQNSNPPIFRFPSIVTIERQDRATVLFQTWNGNVTLVHMKKLYRATFVQLDGLEHLLHLLQQIRQPIVHLVLSVQLRIRQVAIANVTASTVEASVS